MDDRWWLQEEFEGVPVMIRKEGGHITGINQASVKIDLPTAIVEAVLRTNSDWCLMEGALIGENCVVFDLLEEATLDLRADSYDLRYAHLTDKVSMVRSGALQLAHMAMSTQEKRAMLEGLKDRRALGVVLKRCDASYSSDDRGGQGSQLTSDF